MINEIKRRIHQEATVAFSGYFKNKLLEQLNKGLRSSSHIHLLPEKELLVLHYLIDSSHTVIDIGANNGLYCLFFNEIKKCKKIIAFEPLPVLYRKLKKWFSNIQLYDIALSNQQGTTRLHIPFINHKLYESRSKLDSLKEENETNHKEIQIKTDTLDNLFLGTTLAELHFIKIDVEGHEMKIIEGGKKTIIRLQPYLLIEIEGRHHNNTILPAIEFVCSLNYSAYFFNAKLKKLAPYSEFDLASMQDKHKQNTFDYCNNFLFIPNNKLDTIDTLNKKIQEHFKP